MKWIYLSPHFDDIALSCGGLVWEQTRAGDEVQVWTLCAGTPPEGALSSFAASLHERWQTGIEAVEQRRWEDIASCQQMGAAYQHLDLPDCIYRSGEAGEYYYASEEAIFGALHPAESILIEALSARLAETIPTGVQVVSPLSLGNHVDHQFVRAAAEHLNRPLWYYADYPYALSRKAELEQLKLEGWTCLCFPISEAGLAGWGKAIAAHASQISTFWRSPDEIPMAVRSYSQAQNGVCLWKRS